MLHQRHTRSQRGGFTLVELLIVIVVIAILAAISVVAYRGVASNAQAAALKANLSQAVTKLETYKVDNGAYPPDQATVAGLLKLDPSVSLTYAASNATSSPAYCLIAAQGTQQFSVGSTATTPATNACVINLVTDPAGTRTGAVPTNLLQWNARWFGSGGAGTTTLVTGAADGPLPGISTYIRKTWTTAPTSASDVGFSHTTGFGSGAATSGYPVAGGTNYVFSSYLRSSRDVAALAWKIAVVWHDATGAFILQTSGTSLASPAGAWVRASFVATAPANAAYVEVVTSNMTFSISPAVGDTLDGTALMVTKGSTLYTYADGNSPGWSWTGAPNASTSFGPPL